MTASDYRIEQNWDVLGLRGSGSLRSHVHQLRQVIDKPFDKPLLQTVHGVGYRLAESRDGV